MFPYLFLLFVGVLGIILFPTPILDEVLYFFTIENIGKGFPSLFESFPSWKPPLFYYFYFLPYKVFRIFLPIEIAFKLPNILIGVLNTYLVYLIVKSRKSEYQATLAALLFFVSPVVFLTNVRVLIDPVYNFFLLLALYLVIKKREKESSTIYFFAGLFKSLMLILSLPIFLFLTKRKNWKYFILSFLLSCLFHYIYIWIFGGEKLAFETFFYDMITKKVSPLAHLHEKLAVIFFPAFFAFISARGKNMILFLLSLLPIISSHNFYWYFYFSAAIWCYLLVDLFDPRSKAEFYLLHILVLIGLVGSLIGIEELKRAVKIERVREALYIIPYGEIHQIFYQYIDEGKVCFFLYPSTNSNKEIMLNSLRREPTKEISRIFWDGSKGFFYCNTSPHWAVLYPSIEIPKNCLKNERFSLLPISELREFITDQNLTSSSSLEHTS